MGRNVDWLMLSLLERLIGFSTLFSSAIGLPKGVDMLRLFTIVFVKPESLCGLTKRTVLFFKLLI
ncbi:hypothetical protein PSEUDO9AG_40751 [Pseudomonas sp. 9Ag]|nr:hypothetical protein PSEUDO9AG_40751 [Pseudomonas sp. 9Ag]